MQNNQQTGAVLPFIQETRSSWDKLKEEQRPIFIYGMGDGAIKIMTAMAFIEHFSKKFCAPMPLPAHIMPAKTTIAIAK